MRKGKLVTKSLIVLIFILAASDSALAAGAGVGLAEYREKIQTVKESLDYLRHHDEAETPAEIRAEENETLTRIRGILPLTAAVESANTRFDADHGWLFARLKTFENEPSLPKRQTILNELVERLAAVEYKILELENQEMAAALRAKDEDKRKLGEILNRPEYRKPEEKRENFLQKAWRDFWEWLDKVFPKGKPAEASETDAARPFSFVLQLLVLGAALGLIGFLIYRFAPPVREKFRGRVKVRKKKRVILGEILTEDENSHDLFGEAERLARGGDLRAAFRKGYVALLCELSDRKIIGLADHKTNRDYLREVRARPALHQNMNALTESFERVWYGFGAAESRDWDGFKEKYRQTVEDKIKN